MIDRVKLLQSKDKFDLTTNVVFLEEFNAIKRSYPTLMSSYNVGLEENSDPKIQLNQFVVNLEGIGDKIKRGAQWVWEKIKQLWNKIKEFFSRIFRGKQKEVEEKMNAVNSSDDAAKKAVAAEMKKIDEKSPGEALNVANQSMNESEQALKSIENKVPNIMGAIMHSFEKQIDTLADIQNTKKEIAIAGELAKESTKKLNRSTEELKLAERGIEITPEIEKFLDTPIAKFVAASPDGLGNFTYKFVVTDDGKLIVLEEKFDPKANGKLMQGMTAEETEKAIKEDVDGYLSAHNFSALKDLINAELKGIKEAELVFERFETSMNHLIEKAEKELANKAEPIIDKIKKTGTKLVGFIKNIFTRSVKPVALHQSTIDYLNKKTGQWNEELVELKHEESIKSESAYDDFEFDVDKEYYAFDWPRFFASPIVTLYRRFSNGGETTIESPGTLVQIFLSKGTVVGDFLQLSNVAFNPFVTVAFIAGQKTQKTGLGAGKDLAKKELKDMKNAYSILVNEYSKVDVKDPQKYNQLVTDFAKVVEVIKKNICKKCPKRKLAVGELNDLKLFKPEKIKPELDKASRAITAACKGDKALIKKWDQVYNRLANLSTSIVKYLTANLHGYKD